MAFLEPPYNPIVVDDVLLAFPGHVQFLMPDPEEILPLRSLPGMWRQFFDDWFRYGLDDVALYCQSGIDGETAFRHLKCIMGSYEPKHQHKEQAVVFLASRWFREGSTWHRLNK